MRRASSSRRGVKRRGRTSPPHRKCLADLAGHFLRQWPGQHEAHRCTLPLHAGQPLPACGNWLRCRSAASISGSPRRSGAGAARPRTRSRSYDAVCVLALAVHTAARRRPAHGMPCASLVLRPRSSLARSGSAVAPGCAGPLALSSHCSSGLRPFGATTCRLAPPPSGLARPTPRARLLAPLVTGRLLRPPLRAPLAYRLANASVRVAALGSVGPLRRIPGAERSGSGWWAGCAGAVLSLRSLATLARHGARWPRTLHRAAIKTAAMPEVASPLPESTARASAPEESSAKSINQ